MYKLIVTDVDGTLLDQDSKLPPFNKKALFECMDRGIGVMLATGKTLDAVLALIKELNLELPQITQSGATTVNSYHEIIDSKTIGPGYFFKLIKIIKHKGYSPLTCLGDGRVFYDNYHPNMKHLIDVGEKLIKVDTIETDHFAQQSTIINIPIKETDPLDSFLRKNYGHKLQIVRSGEYFFDILNKNATKGNALLKVLKILDIDRRQVVAFGDSYNDLSLFDVAGLRVAVKNSYPRILEKADIVTDENYNCGLGKAIFKYILKQKYYSGAQ